MTSKKGKIFVADDDEDILDIISMILQTAQYDVQASTNAYDIFESTDNLPDLILLDIWMSGLDGREVCRKLKSSPLTKEIPLFFISANSGIEEITRECQADGFIAKPFEMDYLLTRVKNVMSPAI
jgi:DNA-binding response OmpR family regulator